MYFITWKEDETNPVQPGETDAAKIEECSVINLAVIGNIRPDWYLDKRGTFVLINVFSKNYSGMY